MDSLAAGAPGVAAAPVPPCLLAVAGAVRTLSSVGYVCPSWRSILDGVRPGTALPGAAQDGAVVEPGTWIQGWQRTVAKVVETAAADLLRGQLSHPMCARLRSQGGVGAGMWLQVFPTDPALWFESALFQTALRLRLMQPLPLSVVSCTCGAHLDPWGIHLQACMQTGRVSRRAVLQEQALWQVLRETGATARHRPFLRDLSVPGVLGTDARRLDVVASGLPVYGGRTLVIDATLRSPLTGAGHVRFDAHLTDGATFTQARLDKEHKYPELASQGSRLKFLVAAAEVGGRYNDEVVDLIRDFELSRVGAFTYSPEEGTPGFGLEGAVPEDVALARRDAVLAERDAQLARVQEAAIGTEVEVLVDEPPDPDGGVIVGRADGDAPEVDMVTFVEAPDAAVGDRLRVRVEATDEEHNWIATEVAGERA